MTTVEKQRRLLLAYLLGGLHTVLFIFITIKVSVSPDPEMEMLYLVFFLIDYPVSRIFKFIDHDLVLHAILVLGGLLWFVYGWVIQSLFATRSRHKVRRLGVSLLCLTLLLLLPELYLKALPSWEEQWNRGTADAVSLDRRIGYVSKAIELSPPDKRVFYRMWDYLGGIQTEAEDYAAAEASLNAALDALGGEASPRDYLHAHNRLCWFYERVQNTGGRKKHLREAIRFNRLVYGMDSGQEASCWEELASIALQEGHVDEALRLIDKAILMEEGRGKEKSTWSLNYRKELRDEWVRSAGEER